MICISKDAGLPTWRALLPGGNMCPEHWHHALQSQTKRQRDLAERQPTLSNINARQVDESASTTMQNPASLASIAAKQRLAPRAAHVSAAGVS